jgi:two-component system heavy metal sensor histidine kinase CusS
MALTINEMLDRLEDSFQRLSRFSSDIAHELRTPINNIQGEIQVSFAKERSPAENNELILSVHEEISRISKLIDNLLFLAKSENPQLQLKKEIFNLKNEVSNILDFYEASASEDQIQMKINIFHEIQIWAEKSLFQRVLSNILSNSINYTDKGGSITVTGASTIRGIDIVIEDSGRGIPKNDLPLVFDRLFRVDPSRTATKLGGFGLGLTIVKSIMALHRGTVEIKSEEGQGTTVTLHFPSQL